MRCGCLAAWILPVACEGAEILFGDIAKQDLRAARCATRSRQRPPAGGLEPDPASFGPVLFVVWALFMILAMSNGVNLTDAHRQWASRPADERFWTIGEALERTRYHRETAREVAFPWDAVRLAPAGEGGATTSVVVTSAEARAARGAAPHAPVAMADMMPERALSRPSGSAIGPRPSAARAGRRAGRSRRR